MKKTDQFIVDIVSAAIQRSVKFGIADPRWVTLTVKDVQLNQIPSLVGWVKRSETQQIWGVGFHFVSPNLRDKWY